MILSGMPPAIPPTRPHLRPPRRSQQTMYVQYHLIRGIFRLAVTLEIQTAPNYCRRNQTSPALIDRQPHARTQAMAETCGTAAALINMIFTFQPKQMPSMGAAASTAIIRAISILFSHRRRPRARTEPINVSHRTPDAHTQSIS